MSSLGAVLACALLSSCGGGGDAATPVPTPVATNPTPAADAVPTFADTVGTVRILSAESTVTLGGAPEVPPPASAFPISGTSGRSYFVDSRNGDDRHDGLVAAAGGNGAGPWKSLARVMQSDLGPGDTLVLACGSTWNETLRVPANGTATSPVLVTAPPAGCGATPRPTIDGSVAIPASAWTLHSGNLYWTTLAATPLQLFATTGVMVEAHHPNRGHDSADPYSPYTPAAGANTVTTTTGQGSNQIIASAGLQLPGNADLTVSMRIRVRSAAWKLDDIPVESVAGNTISLSRATTYPVQIGWGYYLVGAAWMLDSPGEWHHDAVTGRLLAWMPDGFAPAQYIRATVLRTGADFSGRQFVALSGVKVSRTALAINLAGSSDITVSAVVIEDASEYGIDAPASIRIRVVSSQIRRTGNTAVAIRSPAGGLSTQAFIADNHIRDAGVLMQESERAAGLPRDSASAIVSGFQASVQRNVIINTGYTAITAKPGTTVEGNIIYGACSVLDDCGGIYADGAQNGSVITNNIVIRSRGAPSGKPPKERFTQAQGIYLDESASNVRVDSNTVMDADNGIQLHVAANNLIVGNRLYANRRSQIWLQETRARDNASGDVYGNKIVNNLIAPIHPAAVGVHLQTRFASTANFAQFEGNYYYDRISPVALVQTIGSDVREFGFREWQGTTSPTLPAEHDRAGAAVSTSGSVAYSSSGSNRISNPAFVDNLSGWSSWNETSPKGQLTREACDSGFCLRYRPGASPGLIASPNFTVEQGKWYRLSVDLAADTDNQPVTVVVRRNGGGYERLTDRSFVFVADKFPRRASIMFRATKTVRMNDPLTGENGARVDFDQLSAGRSISLTNMEVVEIGIEPISLFSFAVVNLATESRPVDCPFSGDLAAVCQLTMSLNGFSALNRWPLALPGHSSAVAFASSLGANDTDFDGVPDRMDRCLSTPRREAVNAAGCGLSEL